MDLSTISYGRDLIQLNQCPFIIFVIILKTNKVHNDRLMLVSRLVLRSLGNDFDVKKRYVIFNDYNFQIKNN